MDRQHCKVFVGGLNWETTDEKLRRYFENYGTVLEAFVSYDRATMKPRGFGFVVFEDAAVSDKVVKLQHTIDRREVEAKKAVPKDEAATKPVAPGLLATRTRKCFVGGLPASADEQVLRSYFEQFGPVDDAVVMYDHDNKRPRGFGFVTFATEDSVDRCLAKGHLQLLQDKQIEVKRAVPKDQMQQATAAAVQPGPAALGSSPRQALLHGQPTPLAYPPGAVPPSALPAYAALLQQQHMPGLMHPALPHSSIGSATPSLTSLGQSHQLLALQQQHKLHSTTVAAQLGVLTNTMSGVVGSTPGWSVAGHSAPAGPAGGLPGAYPQQVTGPLNLGAVQAAAPAYASIAAPPDSALNQQLMWELSGGGGSLVGVPPGSLAVSQAYDAAALAYDSAALASLGAGQPANNAALWNATTAAVLNTSGARGAASLPLQQALQNGSSSNSSHLTDVPLSFS